MNLIYRPILVELDNTKNKIFIFEIDSKDRIEEITKFIFTKVKNI